MPADPVTSYIKSDTSREDAVMMYIENYYIGLTKSMEERQRRWEIRRTL